MARTDEQRRHIRRELAGLRDEADDQDAAEDARRAFVLETAIAPCPLPSLRCRHT